MSTREKYAALKSLTILKRKFAIWNDILIFVKKRHLSLGYRGLDLLHLYWAGDPYLLLYILFSFMHTMPVIMVVELLPAFTRLFIPYISTIFYMFRLHSTYIILFGDHQVHLRCSYCMILYTIELVDSKDSLYLGTLISLQCLYHSLLSCFVQNSVWLPFFYHWWHCLCVQMPLSSGDFCVH